MQKLHYTIEMDSSDFSVAEVCQILNANKTEIEKKLGEMKQSVAERTLAGLSGVTVCVRVGPVTICVGVEV